MLKRKVYSKFSDYKKKNKALLITGARQVGKSFIAREYGKNNFKQVIEINFLKDKNALNALRNISDSKDLMLKLSALVGKPFIKGNTLFIFDEVQEIPDLLTHIKFLVEEGKYNFILTGSLLGVKLKDIRSIPVGYMDSLEMFPLDFEEFMIANGLQSDISGYLRSCFEKKEPVDSFVHEKMMQLFRLYLIVGGMPEAVQEYVNSNDLSAVQLIQKNIIEMYKYDIAKYEQENKLHLTEVLESIPAELNSKNKRFILKNLNEKARFSKYENSFEWLNNAGVALPVYVAEEPRIPLNLSRKVNLFKLFMNDVGLLASMYETGGIQLKILNKEISVNNGAIFENAVAQELKALGYNLFYFISKKLGEIDFLIEYKGEILPIEIKSGSRLTQHSALNNLINSYDIKEAFVFGDCNFKQIEKISYFPVYMLMFLKPYKLPEKLIYSIDLSDIGKHIK